MEDVYSIYLAQDRNRDLAFVNTVTNMSDWKSISFTKKSLCSGHRSFVRSLAMRVATPVPCSTRVTTESRVDHVFPQTR